jgi:hypothetical protein
VFGEKPEKEVGDSPIVIESEPSFPDSATNNREAEK